jgi:hypothetical protein
MNVYKSFVFDKVPDEEQLKKVSFKPDKKVLVTPYTDIEILYSGKNQIGSNVPIGFFFKINVKQIGIKDGKKVKIKRSIITSSVVLLNKLVHIAIENDNTLIGVNLTITKKVNNNKTDYIVKQVK